MTLYSELTQPAITPAGFYFDGITLKAAGYTGVCPLITGKPHDVEPEIFNACNHPIERFEPKGFIHETIGMQLVT